MTSSNPLKALEEAAAALEPFATRGDELDEATDNWKDAARFEDKLTIGDLRRARSALITVREALVAAQPSVELASWYCANCSVEVYDRRCPHCGKLERDKA